MAFTSEMSDSAHIPHIKHIMCPMLHQNIIDALAIHIPDLNLLSRCFVEILVMPSSAFVRRQLVDRRTYVGKTKKQVMTVTSSAYPAFKDQVYGSDAIVVNVRVVWDGHHHHMNN